MCHMLIKALHIIIVPHAATLAVVVAGMVHHGLAARSGDIQPPPGGKYYLIWLAGRMVKTVFVIPTFVGFTFNMSGFVL